MKNKNPFPTFCFILFSITISKTVLFSWKNLSYIIAKLWELELQRTSNDFPSILSHLLSLSTPLASLKKRSILPNWSGDLPQL